MFYTNISQPSEVRYPVFWIWFVLQAFFILTHGRRVENKNRNNFPNSEIELTSTLVKCMYERNMRNVFAYLHQIMLEQASTF